MSKHPRTVSAIVALIVASSAAVADVAPAVTAGDLDPSFARDGKTLLLDIRIPHEVLVQEDGKILIVGESAGDFRVVRLNPDGSRDKSFDGDGAAIADFGGDDRAYAAALQADAKILVAGSSSAAGFGERAAVARLDPNGQLDPTFDPGGADGDGMKILPNAGTAYQSDVRAVLVQPDRRIVLAGSGFSGDESSITATRLTRSGAVDGTMFEHAGFGSQVNAAAAALGADGKVVVAGTRYVPDGNRFEIALARFDVDGLLDATLAGDGKLTFGESEQVAAVLVQPDGKVVVAGATGGFETPAMVATRFNRDGTPDMSFDSDARAGADFDGVSLAGAAALRPDGKIVLAGVAVPPFDFAIARLNAAGGLDSTFGSRGMTTVDFGDIEAASAIAHQSDGRMVVAGESQVGAVIARLLADPPPSPGSGPGSPQPATPAPRCAGKRATIVGTPGRDRLRGTSRTDVIVALGGNDRVVARGGRDLVCGGTGRDRLSGGAGRDRLLGGPGRDVLLGGAGRDRLIGGAGKDRVVPG